MSEITTSTDKTISDADLDRLSNLEATIETGLQTFLEVGEALAEIRDSKLYRANHETFDAYCRDRWGFGDRRARQLMAAAEIGTVVPIDNEAQARELAPLKGDEQAVIEAWRDALAQAEELGGTLTATIVANAVQRHVRRIEQVVERGAAASATVTCNDCGATFKTTELKWVSDSTRVIRCFACDGRHRASEEGQTERQRQVARANYDRLFTALGSLHAIGRGVEDGTIEKTIHKAMSVLAERQEIAGLIEDLTAAEKAIRGMRAIVEQEAA